VSKAEPLLAHVFNRRMLICLLCGFSSGMPLYVTLQLIPAWLKDQGASIEQIGLFALTGVPYTWKFVWAPLLDRYVPPILGRRRGWALVTQLLLAASLAAYATLDPLRSLWTIAGLTLAVSLFSATQDIALDAWRRELLPDNELGLGNSLFVNAYRVSSLVPGGLALILADTLPWSQVHLVVASFMGVGVVTTLLAPEGELSPAAPTSLRAAVVEPFRELLQRGDLRHTVELLTFMLLYKLGDSMATALVTAFYLDIGFSLLQIGSIAKVVGLWSSITGATLGGVIMARLGIRRCLWIFGVVQSVCILAFAALAQIGPDPVALGVAVAAEYLGVGLGTAAFVAFLASATDRRFTATQYALFSSFVALPRTFANASTGYLADAVGWTWFFVLCAVASIPGLLLLPRVAPWPSTDEDAA
jgi:PAT family beta-lactamase induction signal transducer AmpG